jgi:UDP-N-acetylglucosamine 4-epimerase
MQILITGAAGFIGSNLTKSIIQREDISSIKLLDNLSTGNWENLGDLFSHPKVEIIEGDIRDLDLCLNSTKSVDLICHQAALGSVPRSIKDPISSHEVNVNGFLNLLEAAKINNVKRLVYASSSSVYGDIEQSPKVEGNIGKPLSPYAATKLSNEIYANVFSNVYKMQIIGLRYFNVFGRSQNPNGPYAAVVPRFINAALSNTSPTIFGDGSVERDFTPITNVVNANQLALFSKLPDNFRHEVFNIACGQSTTILQIWNMIKKICEVENVPVFQENRMGDIPKSLADISKAKQMLGYDPDTNIFENLKEAIGYYKNQPIH